MATRLELQSKLESILGSRNVYFQPPATVKMKYPAIVYNRETIHNRYADDQTYHNRKQYRITLIGSDPDSSLINDILELPMCRYIRFYTADNLNHDQFNIYW